MKLLRTLLSVALAAAVLAPAAAQAATPMSGVPTPIRRGFFTELDMGAFFTTGGQGKSPSDAQVYTALGLGYDVYSTGKHFVSAGLTFSWGTSAGSCYGTSYDPESETPCLGSQIDPVTNKTEVLSANWSATTFEASALYGYQIIPRLMLTGRLLGGMALIEPKAFEDTEDMVPLMGLGLGAEYATQFDHFSLGLDIAGKMFLGTDAMGVAIAPRVKYTF